MYSLNVFGPLFTVGNEMVISVCNIILALVSTTLEVECASKLLLANNTTHELTLNQ